MNVLELDWNEFIKLRKDLPTIDVRSSLEFAKGHIPGALNIPLLKDEERAVVGKEYKQRGKSEAVKIGFQLVGPRLHDMMTEVEKIAKDKALLVYCWRGGMRSYNFSQFVEMVGIKTHVLTGGYKTYRKQALHSFGLPFRFILISGYTGSGKSEILRSLQSKGEQVIDLEAMAKHKGSVFGGLSTFQSQPSTEHFQNILFEQLLTFDTSKPIWIEDESIAIGKVFLPNDFWDSMRSNPIVLLHVDKEIRTTRLVREYGFINKMDFLEAMTKITKKLGGQHFKEAKEKLLQNDMKEVIDILLTHYYDKAYRSNLEKRNPEKWYTLNWDGVCAEQAATKLIAGVVKYTALV